MIIGGFVIFVELVYTDFIARIWLTEAMEFTKGLKKSINSVQSFRCRSLNESECKQFGNDGIEEIITDSSFSNNNRVYFW